MSRYKYLIKTEQEFINEFGHYWRYDRLDRISFTEGMDYLFGSEIDVKYYSNFLVNNRLVLNGQNYIRLTDCYGRQWCINYQMIKEVFIVPNYNEKRKLVYE